MQDGLDWDSYSKLLTGLNIQDLHRGITESYIEPAINSVGRDMPIDPSRHISLNYELFMNTEFVIPIKNLSIKELYDATIRKRKDDERSYNPLNPHTKDFGTIMDMLIILLRKVIRRMTMMVLLEEYKSL